MVEYLPQQGGNLGVGGVPLQDCQEDVVHLCRCECPVGHHLLVGQSHHLPIHQVTPLLFRSKQWNIVKVISFALLMFIPLLLIVLLFFIFLLLFYNGVIPVLHHAHDIPDIVVSTRAVTALLHHIALEFLELGWRDIFVVGEQLKWNALGLVQLGSEEDDGVQPGLEFLGDVLVVLVVEIQQVYCGAIRQ